MKIVVRAACALTIAAAMSATAALQTPSPQAQPAAPAPSTPLAHPMLQGEWTLNAGASASAPSSSAGDGQPSQPSSGARGRRGGFGGGRGGAGSGGFGGGSSRGSADGQSASQREAMREFTNPASRLTIVQTDTAIIITTEDGRTTRLAPTDKKVKDDGTSIQRKTKWDGDKLVSEVSGLQGGSVTQSYWLDAGAHQLHVVTMLPNRQDSKVPIMLDRVYDASK